MVMISWWWLLISISEQVSIKSDEVRWFSEVLLIKEHCMGSVYG